MRHAINYHLKKRNRIILCIVQSINKSMDTLCKVGPQIFQEGVKFQKTVGLQESVQL